MSSKIYIPICYWCKHYHNVMRKGSLGKCKAFPDGIPNEVWDSTLDHRKPINGDKSIQFEQVEDMKDVRDDMKILLEAAELSSETGLRMAFEMLDEQENWRWDDRYPKIKPE
jgi:hypothetical protein